MNQLAEGEIGPDESRELLLEDLRQAKRLEIDLETRCRLAYPFPVDEIQWKPQVNLDNGALCAAYIDARSVMGRLDDVFGVGGWQDHMTLTASGVICALKVKLHGEWVQKSDVSAFQQTAVQEQGGGKGKGRGGIDQFKSSVSDALKRAAVKFGVGRYLYALDMEFCPAEIVKDFRRMRDWRPSKIPPWAIPADGKAVQAVRDEVTACVRRGDTSRGPLLLEYFRLSSFAHMNAEQAERILKNLRTRRSEFETSQAKSQAAGKN